jgi:hypothetical protein
VRALVKEAIDTGEIAYDAGQHGAIWVARKGTVFDQVAKNGAAKNGVANFGDTHSRRKGGTVDGSEAQKEAGVSLSTRSGARAAAERDSFASRREDAIDTDHGVDGKKPSAAKAKKTSVDRSAAPKKEAAELLAQPTPEWIILSDWKCSRYFQEHGLAFTDMPQAIATIANWRWRLEHFAGSPEKVPPHLYAPAAYRQMLEIVHELAARSNDRNFTPWRAMVGFAFAVCQALAKRRSIRSFSFIVEGLARKLYSGDVTWAFDVPSRLPQAKFDEAYQLATKAVDMCERRGWKIDKRELLATTQVEDLAEMIGRVGYQCVKDGLERALNGSRRRAEGWCVNGWCWFDPEIFDQWRQSQPPKPPRMRVHTYRRLLDAQYRELQSRGEGAK